MSPAGFTMLAIVGAAWSMLLTPMHGLLGALAMLLLFAAADGGFIRGNAAGAILLAMLLAPFVYWAVLQ